MVAICDPATQKDEARGLGVQNYNLCYVARFCIKHQNQQLQWKNTNNLQNLGARLRIVVRGCCQAHEKNYFKNLYVYLFACAHLKV